MRALEDALKTASEGECNLAIFPEYFLQGIVAETPEKVYNHGEGPQEEVAQLARSYGLDIVIGTLVEKAPPSAVAAKAHHGAGGDDDPRDPKVYNT